MNKDKGELSREIEEEESKTAIQSLNVRITVIIDKQQPDENNGFEFDGTRKTSHKQVKIPAAFKNGVFKDMVKANEELQGMERVGRNRKYKFIKFFEIAVWMWNQDDSTPEDPYDTETVRILSVTWNLHGKLPSTN